MINLRGSTQALSSFMKSVAVSLFLIFAAIAQAEKPNVVLILADDMALGDLSSLNGGLSKTPNLDALKSRSVWFHRAYSASPVCAPARAALMTGRYPHRTGAVTLNMEKHPELARIRLNEVTIADVFRANGYKTGLIGKWHSGIGPEYHPLARGFDEFEGFIGHLYVPSYFDYKLDIGRETQAFPNRYLTTDLSNRAVEFVRRRRDGPFFLHLAHYAPHRPIEAPAERIAPYLEAGLDEETATVYAMIEIMDEGIGELLDELKRLQLLEETIVIFASDNGPDPLVAKRFNLDLRGSKYEVHEGGIRVPFFVQWQGRLEPAESEEVISFTDILPTLVELCGLDFEPTNPLDGASFAKALRGEKLELRPRFWQWNRAEPRYSHNAAMLDGDWKLVRPFVTKNYPKGDSNLPPMLFNLRDDPAEATDVSTMHQKRAQDMNAALQRWTTSVEHDRTFEAAANSKR